MEIISVGPDELNEWDLEIIPADVELFVYYYEIDYYEGSGVAIFKRNDKYGLHYLGHCSCYGPMEDFDGITIYTAEEMEKIVQNGDYQYNHAPEVWAKLKESL